MVVLLVNESLRSLQDYQMLVYGVLMLLVIIAIPGGIYGLVKDLLAKRKNSTVKEGGANA